MAKVALRLTGARSAPYENLRALRVLRGENSNPISVVTLPR